MENVRNMRAVSLVRWMLNIDRQARPNAIMCLEHSYFRSCENDDMKDVPNNYNLWKIWYIKIVEKFLILKFRFKKFLICFSNMARIYPLVIFYH